MSAGATALANPEAAATRSSEGRNLSPRSPRAVPKHESGMGGETLPAAADKGIPAITETPEEERSVAALRAIAPAEDTTSPFTRADPLSLARTRPPRSKFVNPSVDDLLTELARKQLRLDAAEADARMAEQGRVELVNEVVKLQAEKRRVEAEAVVWRDKALELQKSCASLEMREEGTRSDLRESMERERQLAVQAIERRLAAAEIENQQTRTETEARNAQWNVHRVEQELEVRLAEVDALRKEARDLMAHSETQRLELRQLEATHGDLEQDHKEQYEVLCNANRRSGTLEARIENMQAAWETSVKKQSELTDEVMTVRQCCLRLEEANRRLRSDLQDSLAQTTRLGEAPFYAGRERERGRVAAAIDNCIAGELARDFEAADGMRQPPAQLALGNGTEAMQSPRRSPKTRMDYPRSAHARQLREKVMYSRNDAIDRIDHLGASLC